MNERQRMMAWGAVAGLAVGGAVWWRNHRRVDSFAGRTALVTGGSTGLGLHIARKLAAGGARVTICSRDVEELVWAQEQLAEEGYCVSTAVCDVGDAEQVADLFDQVEQTHGPVEVLVNNAGIIQVGPVESMTRQDFEEAMDVMFWGIYNPVMAALPAMREMGDGHIINVTSIGGEVAVPHVLPYTAAKGAAVEFSKGLAAELAREGISVTTAVPGLLRTGAFVNARFHGDPEAEFKWFASGAVTPFVSTGVERAASQIVRAAKKRQAYMTVGLPAAVARRIEGIMPGTMNRIMRGVNAVVMPKDQDRQGRATGAEVAREGGGALHNAIIRAGEPLVQKSQPPQQPI